MVCDAHLAEDVTQVAFVALAQNARELTHRPVLSGWLHRTAQNLATKVVRTEARRRVREHEAAAMNELLSAEADTTWKHIAPQLDAALGELSEPDRDALLLRYFERKSASEMAQSLGISDEAAQKRVNRAVERLREFFAKRGVTVGASGLVVVISANAVQAAPVGLAVTISTAAALAGTTLATATTATAAKAIAMTTVQKALITVTTAVAIGAGVYEARQNSTLRSQVQTLQQQYAPLMDQIQELQHDRDDATNRLATLREENETLKGNLAGLPKLRGEVARLRGNLGAAARDAVKAAAPKGNAFSEMFKDPAMLEAMRPQQIATEKMMYAPLVKQLNLSPEQADKFYNILVDNGLKSMQALQSGTISPDDIKSSKQSLAADLQSLLGDDGYTQYQNFTKNDMADQTMLTLMRNDFMDNPLSDTQQQQLLQVMKSARQSMTANSPLDPSQANPFDTGQVLQQQEQMNQSVLQQAAAFLSPAQLQTLGTSQSNIISMQKASAPMMQKMLGK
jgi:RNA polymerase sigma factor (sigma-70 family)